MGAKKTNTVKAKKEYSWGVKGRAAAAADMRDDSVSVNEGDFRYWLVCESEDEAALLALDGGDAEDTKTEALSFAPGSPRAQAFAEAWDGYRRGLFGGPVGKNFAVGNHVLMVGDPEEQVVVAVRHEPRTAPDVEHRSDDADGAIANIGLYQVGEYPDTSFTVSVPSDALADGFVRVWDALAKR